MNAGVRRAARLIGLLFLSTSAFYGYSVLTHEAIVDAVWDASIQKMLLARFPAASPEELEQAHAYVYGGCIVQDMGYYPFSSPFFSDLTHYVRSGDFVAALIRESQDLNEYAFALGALSHYAADDSGHRIATNLAVPILYPELRRKFGKTVTYWDNPFRISGPNSVSMCYRSQRAAMRRTVIGHSSDSRCQSRCWNEHSGIPTAWR